MNTHYLTQILYLLVVIMISIVSLPLIVVFSLLIILTSGFPVFFRQIRIGKNGKKFVMVKFRSMHNGADVMQPALLDQNEANGPVFKIHNDPRFTRIGAFLNHTGIDELPQLYNVLRGDMALIGPRPLPAAEAKRLKPWMRAREIVLPG
ncbi:MAG: sugar transferase, partial [Pseudomonadota bacterium]